jgi:hypothetical protein
VALARSSLIGGPTSLGGPGRVRGGAEIPDDVMSTDIPNQLEPPFFQRRAEQLVLVLHQTQVLAAGGP